MTAWILAAAMLIAAGCGPESDIEGTETVQPEGSGITNVPEAEWKPAAAAFDLNGSDYVTLCDYSAIPVTITGDYAVDGCTNP